MTDAREIIAKAVEEKLKIDGFSSYEEMAEHLTQALTTSGFRILGPDEVDPVTVEKCIRIVAGSAPDDTGKWCPYRSWALRSIPALRTLGRKA